MKKTERKTIKAPASKTAPKPSPSSASSDNLNLAEVKELIELISEKQFNEFELERGNFRLRLQKGAVRTIVETSLQNVAAAPVVPTPVVMDSKPVEAAPVAAQPAAAPAAEEEALHIITSPIVGTFYRAASPTGEPFVKLGDSIEAGKTICIIEAMKLMNEIPSDASGAVAKVFVENGQPVEYGQPLFGLKL
jgi:acetyl-CoA carboxylase biotin carboxyl carrier protein